MSKKLEDGKGGAHTAALRDLFLTFGNAVGMVKVYPPDHISVVGIGRELWARLQDHLEMQGELEIAVRETSFEVGGEAVYRDENLLKSLPYSFFKAGLESLAFEPGLTREEFGNFFDVVRENALLPLEESDIVSLLWEREFPHVRYTAANDYLEAKIAALDRKPWEAPVDTAAFRRGRIELTPADTNSIVQKSLALGRKGAKETLEAADLTAPLDKKESQFLESLIDTERAISLEKEFLELFFELLCLEERPASLASMLLFLEQHHAELLKNGEFGQAAQLLAALGDFKGQCANEAPSKSQNLEKLSRRIRESVSLAALKERALQGRLDNAPAFFRYLAQFGSRGIPLAADLFEAMPDGIVRSEAFAFLQAAGRENPEVLAGLARDSMPFLSKGVIAMLAGMKERRAIPYLARFKDSQLPAVRLEAVQALAGLADPLAVKILRGFTADPNPEIREAARKAAGMSKG